MWIACIVLLVGCRSKKYVPVETVKTEYRDKKTADTIQTAHWRSVIDSLVERMSVSRADCTVIVQDTDGTVRYHGEWHNTNTTSDKYQNTLREDSTDYYRNMYYALIAQRADNSQVPYPVEKELSKWERFKVDYSTYIILALAFGLVIAVWLVKKRGGN